MADFRDVFDRRLFHRSLAEADAESTDPHTNGPLFGLFPCPPFRARVEAERPGSTAAAQWLPLALVREAERRCRESAPPEPPAKGRRRPPEWVEHDRRVLATAYELTYQALYDRDFVFHVEYESRPASLRQVLGGRWGDPPPVDPNGNLYLGGELPPPARGPDRPRRVMAVGKMPGSDEVVLGRSLVGRSGRLLRAALQEHLVDPRDWHVTNVLRWPHPDPKSDTLPAEWLKTCLPLLRWEIELVRPEFLFLFGSEALKGVLGPKKTLEGCQYRLIEEAIGGRAVKVACSVNAAAVLRKPEYEYPFKKAVAGMAQAVTTGAAWAKETDQLHLEVRTLAQLGRLVELILATPGSEAVAFDCEWHGQFPGEPGSYLRSVQFSWLPKHAAAVVLHDAGGAPVLWPERAEVCRLLARLCKFDQVPGRTPRVIGHNFNADLPWLLHMGLDLKLEFAQPVVELTPGDPLTLAGEELTRTAGGFDTMLSAHAVKETDDFKLELQGVSRLGLHRYDEKLQDWRKQYVAANKMRLVDLDGYGESPGEILIGERLEEFDFGIAVRDSYGCYDADTTRRLFDVHNGVNGQPGLLDRDEFGLSSRRAYWLAMLAAMAFGEFHTQGVRVDPRTAAELSALFEYARDRLVAHLREVARWPTFSPDKYLECAELLFGVENANNRKNGQLVRISPPDAVLADLTPHVTTGKKPKLWSEVVARREAHKYRPGTGKETLMVLEQAHPHVKLLRAVRSVNQALKFVLRPPDRGEEEEDEDDRPVPAAAPAEPDAEEDDPEFSEGMLRFLLSDGRVHSQFFQTKETGRASSARPPMQNLGKSVEAVYEKVFKDYRRVKLGPTEEKEVIARAYSAPIRSMLLARPGHKLADADWTGAELLIAAVQSGDRNMIEHMRRANLPESDPDFYDIHSNVAVRSFKLSCAPTKKGLADAGKKAIRTAAKACVFGTMYGQGAAALARKALQEGAEITVEEAEQLIAGLFELYPDLEQYLAKAEARATDPRWMRNCFGRLRRFPYSDDRQVRGELGRQAKNYPVQCLSLDQNVLTAEGYRPIGELVGAPVTVPGPFGTGRGFCVASGDKTVWEVRTDRGPSHRVSPDHVFFVYRHGALLEARAADLEAGDWVVRGHVRSGARPESRCTSEEAYLLGALVGDGSWADETLIRSTDPGVLARVTAAVRAACGVDPRVRRTPGKRDGYKTPGVVPLPRPAAFVDRMGLGDWAQSGRALPGWVFTDPNRHHVLAGLLDTDGGCGASERDDGVSFTSTSRRLAEGVYLLMSSMGLHPAFAGPYPNGRHSDFYRVHAYGEDAARLLAETGPSHSVRFSRRRERPSKEVRSYPPDLVTRVATTAIAAGLLPRLTPNQRAQLHAMRRTGYGSPAPLRDYVERAGLDPNEFHLDLRFDRVAVVRPTGEVAPMADICVTDGHPSFVLAGTLVHNSSVADAMNLALHHLYWYRYEYDKCDTHWYNLVLQVHDAVVLEVPDYSLEWVVEEVLPTCMSKRVPVWACDFDGNRNPKFDKPFHLQAPPADVFNRWSVGLKRSELLACGTPGRYALRCEACSKQTTSTAELNEFGVCDKCARAAQAAAGGPPC